MSADRAAATDACPLCNESGYRITNGFICDHVDYRPAYDRGMAMVRAVLQKSNESQVRPHAI